jgi:hypothetical protein
VVDIKLASGPFETAMDGVRQAESRGNLWPGGSLSGKLRGARGQGCKLRSGNCRNLGSFASYRQRPVYPTIHRDDPRTARACCFGSCPAGSAARPLETLFSTLPGRFGAGLSLLQASGLPGTVDRRWQSPEKEARAGQVLAGRVVHPACESGDACPSSGRSPW